MRVNTYNMAQDGLTESFSIPMENEEGVPRRGRRKIRGRWRIIAVAV
jgi:hypothetical protein